MNLAKGIIHKELWVLQADSTVKLREDDFEALYQFGLTFPQSLNLMQMVQASAHMADWIHWPENVLPMVQPSHRPALNPAERLWQDLRQRTLSPLEY